jgi:hypothetical protein
MRAVHARGNTLDCSAELYAARVHESETKCSAEIQDISQHDSVGSTYDIPCWLMYNVRVIAMGFEIA